MPRMPEISSMAPASLFRRAGAYLLDSLLFSLLSWGLALPLLPWLDTWGDTSLEILNTLLYMVVAGLFSAEFARRWATSPGKWVLRIWIVDAKTGEIPSLRKAWFRSLGYIPSYGRLGMGFVMILFHRRRQGLHDLLAGTVCLQKSGTWGGL